MRIRLIAAAVLFLGAVAVGAQEAQLGEAESNYLIAKQGKAEVWAIDVDAHLAAVPSRDRAGFIDSPKRIQELISHLLMRRNLALEARELGLDKGKVVARELEQAAEVVLMRYRLEQLRNSIQVPDLEPLAKEKFQANRGAYKSSETVSIAHVLLDAKQRTNQQAYEQLLAWKADVAAGKTRSRSWPRRTPMIPASRITTGCMRARTSTVLFRNSPRPCESWPGLGIFRTR